MNKIKKIFTLFMAFVVGYTQLEANMYQTDYLVKLSHYNNLEKELYEYVIKSTNEYTLVPKYNANLSSKTYNKSSGSLKDDYHNVYQNHDKDELKNKMYEKFDTNQFDGKLTSYIDLANDILFNKSLGANEVIIEIMNREVNKKIDEKKKTEFITKTSSSLINQSDSSFGRVYELESNDEDGIYMGILESRISALSKGYYVKKWTEYNKDDGYLRDFIKIGKANFVDDVAETLYQYKNINKQGENQPLMLSYAAYMNTYSKFKEPSSYSHNGFNGLLKVNGNTQSEIRNNLMSQSMSIDSLEGKKFNELSVGNSKVFQENGEVFHYRIPDLNEQLMTHISMANTFMANNNIKRGYMFNNTDSMNNFSMWKDRKCKRKVLKKCVQYWYWLVMDYYGGLDVYSMQFLDENFMDKWNDIPYTNRNAINNFVTNPTIAPIYTEAKMPSINSENYGTLFATSYVGSIGGKGLYNFPLFEVDINSGQNGRLLSDKKSFWSLGLLTVIIAAVLTFITFGIFLAVIIAIVGLVIYFKSKVPSLNRSEFSIKAIQDVIGDSNSILTQSNSKEGDEELKKSITYNALLNSTASFSIMKNFMSNNFHTEASSRGVKELSSVPKTFFSNATKDSPDIPYIKAMKQNSQFWKPKHHEIIASRYMNNFKSSGEFYSPKKMFRSIIKNYLGY